ncbi:Glycosyltransferase involved in cell wall bisynthesis [Abditibacterium utsteinense]|uniref:Glycosyltransferase involved in cell wall bisynthesis n=1 Tax=Abditibacterium utsteinense TaxID=1960156 RepID=A0A2S8SX48_9BACT|nr:glycosyltransferase family 4 protein [Abditibacterium utsteinense]PQV65380.1 Glycosyltransferase involved in cell wall bisynthesis [Abditibacterium utsteinense]
MKILFVLRNLKVGGGTTFLLRAAMGLLARGHRVEVAAQNGAMKARLQAIGVRVHLLPPTPFNRPQLWALLRRDFDIVHACNPTAGDDIVWALRRLNRRARGATTNLPAFVLSIHGNLPGYVQGNLCLREALEILTFDQSALDRLRKIEWMRPDVHLLPRPVEKRDLQVGPADPPHFVMVSRLSKTKGPAALAAIEAVEKIESRFSGLSLTIFGEGSARDSVLARAENLNVQLGRQAVQAPGSTTDPFEAMHSAAAVVGTSYVALEALFHAIPVVAAGYEGFGVVDEANLDEAVACNFGDGFPGLQPEVTAEWLTPCFERILTHFSGESGRAELERMRVRLTKNHSLDAVAGRLETIYQRAIDAKRNGVKR